ncbi:AMP-binding protein [Actinoplanes sp. LDG1-06]|uniref:AMP-binding protein n=1 Tax=Paractinoplanes ovalisporus TaxID=2810368 RepID=A0ABS2AK30_9ACTN|nr:AMP-binding protein [Actinoplanes ovalisporus]MBM2620135.1 AMP-binding protein [Actinoplanes ovalisporus]
MTTPWPDDTARAYRAAGLWTGEAIASGLPRWAELRGDRVAVTDEETTLTYGELAGRADRLATGLRGLGLRRGDAVLLQLPNTVAFVEVLLACLRIGVAPVLMLPAHRDHEMGAIGAHVGVRAVIVPDEWRGYDHEALAHRVRPEGASVIVAGRPHRAGSVALDDLAAGPAAPIEDPPTGSDVAVYLLSGGTTAVPKVIARTHDDYGYNVRRAVAACGYTSGTVYLAALPAGHNFPLANPGILGTLRAGGRVVMRSSPRPDVFFAAVERERVTDTAAVPAVAVRWAEAASESPYDLSSLRTVQVGGSMLAPEVIAAIGPALGCAVQQVYGMAEGLVCLTRADDSPAVRTGTQGRPISPYDELRVIGRDGRPVAPGEEGELLVRGPYTPRGYFRAPEQNAVSFTADGWFRSGDVVRIVDGSVVVCGRVKDLINRSGEKIAAGEIESLVQELPAVAEAAVVAVPDPVVGERVCAVVRLRPGHRLDLDEIRVHLGQRGVASFKAPERLVVVDDLPRTPVGKPDKAAIRALVGG